MKKISLAHVVFTTAFTMTLTLAVSGVFAATPSFVEVPAKAQRAQVGSALRETFKTYGEIRSDLKQGLLQKVAKRGLDVLVVQGCDRLRAVGEFELAAQFEREWTQQISVALSSNITAFELGDFDPISPWLDNFYNNLYRKTRGLVKGIRVLHDVYLMNYALAVVFKPNGTWRNHSAYDRIEYRKHFIPFTNVATYWVSLQVCRRNLPQVKNYCDRGAGILETVMGKYIAPRISDRVFALATHGHPVSMMAVSKEAEAQFDGEIDFERFANETLSETNSYGVSSIDEE